MALQKDYTYKGVTANYWNIHELKVNKVENTTQVRLALYLSKAVRDANIEEYLDIKSTIELEGVLEAWADIYAALKTKVLGWPEETYEDIDTGEVDEFGEAIINRIYDPFFEDAVDV